VLMIQTQTCCRMQQFQVASAVSFHGVQLLTRITQQHELYSWWRACCCCCCRCCCCLLLLGRLVTPDNTWGPID